MKLSEGKVLGQARALGILQGAVESGSLANAYLFEGPPSVGKELAAITFAKAVVAKGDARLEKRIDNDQHPDVRVFRPREEGSGNIAIETLRQEILPLTQFAPYESEHAFFIFPDADVSFPSFHPQAANALLKTLEEPKRNVHFILSSSRPFQLLVTIRSRCQRLAFEKLSSAVVQQILAQRGIDPAIQQRAADLANGDASRALTFAEDGKASGLLDLALNIHGAVETRKTQAIIDCADQVAKADDLPLALDVLQQLYRDACRNALNLSAPTGSSNARIESLAPAEAARRALLIDDHRRALDYNANPLMATEALLLKMCYTASPS